MVIAPGIHGIGLVPDGLPVVLGLQGHAENHAVRFALVIGVLGPELVGHLFQPGIALGSGQRFDLAEDRGPGVLPAVQPQGAAHEGIDSPVRAESILRHEGQGIAVGINLERFRRGQRGLVAGNRVPGAGDDLLGPASKRFRRRAQRLQHAKRGPAELVAERVGDLGNAAAIADEAMGVGRVECVRRSVICHQRMGHQVVDAGIETHFVDQSQTSLFCLGIQRPHLRRDVRGRDKMRALGNAQLRQRHVPVAGQHRHGHVAGLQGRADRVEVKGPDVLGQVAHGFLSLLDRPVPHHHGLACFDQPAQAGDGRQAGSAPMDRHVTALLVWVISPRVCQTRLLPAPRPRCPDRRASKARAEAARRSPGRTRRATSRAGCRWP